MYNFNDIQQTEKNLFDLSYPRQVDDVRASFFDRPAYRGQDSFYYCFGGAICGPLFTFFCEWAVQMAKKENIRLIFPLMREGALYAGLLKLIIKYFNTDIDVTPLFVSRKSSCLALCYHRFDKNFFYEICDGSNGIEECFCKLGISDARDIYEHDMFHFDLAIRRKREAEIENIYNIILERGLDTEINAHIMVSKRLLSEYLLQKGGHNNFITLDSGSLGTIPQAIDNCSPQNIKTIHLFLAAKFQVLERISKGHDIRFPFSEFGGSSQTAQIFLSAISKHFFETFTMGNLSIGTVIGYEKADIGEIRPIYGKSGYSAPTRKAVNLIQKGIHDFCQGYLSTKQKTKTEYDLSGLLACGLGSFCRFINAPFMEEAKNLGWFEYEDSAFSVPQRFILEQKLPPIPLPESDIDIQPHRASHWIQGSRLLYPPQKSVSEISECRRIVVYGCGYQGKILLEKLQENSVEVVCIVDREKAGGRYLSYPIIEVEHLQNYEFSDVIIATERYADEIEETLNAFSQKYKRAFNVHHIIT